MMPLLMWEEHCRWGRKAGETAGDVGRGWLAGGVGGWGGETP